MEGIVLPGLGPRIRTPDIDGATKVAIVLLAVERPKAIELLKRLDAVEIRAIFESAGRLASIEPDVLSTVIASFEKSYKDGLKFVGNSEEVRKLIADAVGGGGDHESVDEVQPEERAFDPWMALSNQTSEELQAYLLGQHPQVAAYILSKLQSSRIAELLQRVEEDVCSDLMTRMLAVGQLRPEIAKSITEGMTFELERKKPASDTRMIGEIAAVLNRLDQVRSAEVVARLHSARPADAKRLERLLFRFEDLLRLPSAALAAVVEQVPTEQMIVGLISADTDMRAAVLGAMSPRSRRMVESELQNAQIPNAKLQADARQGIVATVLRLVSAGVIDIEAKGA